MLIDLEVVCFCRICHVGGKGGACSVMSRSGCRKTGVKTWHGSVCVAPGVLVHLKCI